MVAAPAAAICLLAVRRIHLVFLAACAIGECQQSITLIPQRMERFIADKTVAGTVTLVAQGGKVVEFDAQGMADIEASRPMQKDTIFQIMSMTKPITAIGIMMLAEQGKLALRDPVEQYLPEFRGQPVASNVGPDAARLRTPDHSRSAYAHCGNIGLRAGRNSRLSTAYECAAG
jgi:CubicO group peptidase (beta-lactamase class C family)